MEQEMLESDEFVPGTPPEVQDAVVKIRQMIEDPEMDEAIVMALKNKNVAQGIAMFVNSVIIPSIDKLGLTPDMVMTETGVVSNIIVDMIANAIELGLVEEDDAEMQGQIATETMKLLERAMSEGRPEAPMEGQPMQKGPPKGPPMRGAPQGPPMGKGIPAGLGAVQ